MRFIGGISFFLAKFCFSVQFFHADVLDRWKTSVGAKSLLADNLIFRAEKVISDSF